MSDQAAKPPSVDAEPMSWALTRRLIRSDFNRLSQWYGGGPLSRRVYWFFQPNFQALFLYRLYRYLYLNGWRNSARSLFMFSLYLTGADISPSTSIGEACLIGHAVGIIVCGKLGARCTLYGQGGTGGGIGDDDIGGGPGLPVVGDDVMFGVKAIALGTIRIGNRVNLGPAAVATSNVPDDAMVVALPSKIIKVRMGGAASTAES